LGRVVRLSSVLVICALVVLSIRALDLDSIRLGGSLGRLVDVLKSSVPPDRGVVGPVARETWRTVQMALLATAIATVVAAPLAFLAARNVVASAFIRYPVRAFLNALRAVDMLIYAVVFIGAFGPGPLAGVLALALQSIGVIGKLFFEAVEAAPQGPVDAVLSAGGTKTAVVRYGLLPQVGPHFASFLVYRLEHNIRSAIVLGLVGAGGVGFLLEQYVNLFQFRRMAVVVITIQILVTTLDLVSARIRRTLIGR
jgi:phosphonate transport system permease protein